MQSPEAKPHERIKSTFHVYCMCLNMSLGLFFMGYNQGVFNPVQLVLINLHGITEEKEIALYKGIMTASNPVGGLIGALLASRFLMIFGTIRRSLIVNDLLCLIFSAIEICSTNLGLIIFGRCMVGVTAGINTALCPIYIREFSPMEVAGRTGAFNNLMQKFGVLISYCMGYMLPTKKVLKSLAEAGTPYNNQDDWRIVVGAPSMVAAAVRMLLLLLVFREDTPTEMLREKHQAELRNFLHNVYNDEDIELAMHEYEEKYENAVALQKRQEHHDNDQNAAKPLAINAPEPTKNVPAPAPAPAVQNVPAPVPTLKSAQQRPNNNNSVPPSNSGDHPIELPNITPQVSQNPNQVQQPIKAVEQQPVKVIEQQPKEKELSNADLVQFTLWRRRALGWFISLTVSFSAIDAIIYYSNTIFEEMGQSANARTYTVIIGAVCVGYSLIGTQYVNWVGRRTAVISSALVMTIALLLIVIAAGLKVPLAELIAVLFHLLGYNASLGPVRWACYVELMDPFGVGIASTLVFVFAAIIGFVFPYMVLGLSLAGAFGVFLGLEAFCLIFHFFAMKETKGKTQNEIYKMFLPTHKEKKTHIDHRHDVHVLELAASGHIHLEKRKAK